LLFVDAADNTLYLYNKPFGKELFLSTKPCTENPDKACSVQITKSIPLQPQLITALTKFAESRADKKTLQRIKTEKNFVKLTNDEQLLYGTLMFIEAIKRYGQDSHSTKELLMVGVDEEGVLFQQFVFAYKTPRLKKKKLVVSAGARLTVLETKNDLCRVHFKCDAWTPDFSKTIKQELAVGWIRSREIVRVTFMSLWNNYREQATGEAFRLGGLSRSHFGGTPWFVEGESLVYEKGELVALRYHMAFVFGGNNKKRMEELQKNKSATHIVQYDLGTKKWSLVTLHIFILEWERGNYGDTYIPRFPEKQVSILVTKTAAKIVSRHGP